MLFSDLREAGNRFRRTLQKESGILVADVIGNELHVFRLFVEQEQEPGASLKIFSAAVEVKSVAADLHFPGFCAFSPVHVADDIPGLTKGMVTDYIKYLGNLRWAGLGYGTLYEGYDSEPENMAWVSQYSNANMVKTDFFEAKSTAYAKSTALVDDL